MSHTASSNERQKGFTIVELLIVIVVIGILAAITIVAYNGIQNRTYDASVQSDLSAAAKKIELAAVDAGSYNIPTAATGITVTKSAYRLAEPNLYFCKNTTTNQFVLSAQSKSNKMYKYISSGGLSEHTTRLYGQTTCDLVGSTYTGNGTLGYDSTTGQWINWITN